MSLAVIGSTVRSGGQLIRNVGPTNDNGADAEVACRSRLGWMQNYYYREVE